MRLKNALKDVNSIAGSVVLFHKVLYNDLYLHYEMSMAIKHGCGGNAWIF